MADNSSRKLYKIGYLTERLGVTPRTIRYYDQMGLLPHVKRSEGNVRLFDDEDVEIIKKIRRMQKEDYMPLDIIKEKLFGFASEDKNEHIAIVTDSTAVLPRNTPDELNITIIPLKLIMNGKEVNDDPKVSKTEFWKKVEKGKAELKTVAPTKEEFVDLYYELKRKGFTKVYSIHLASNLSKTYENASLAAGIASDQIDVVTIDSKTTGAGLGLFVVQAAETIKNGESQQQIKVFLDKQIPLIYYTTMVNDMRYLTLNTGPDMDSVSQPDLLKKLYEFKPIFTLKSDGDIDIIDCVKTQKEAEDLLVEHLEQEYINRGKYSKYIMITYNYLYGEAVAISNRIKEVCPATPVYLEECCTALTTYLGPETISISIA